jgi:hypothetical protein
MSTVTIPNDAHKGVPDEYKAIVDTLPDKCTVVNEAAVFSWSIKGFGFGELRFFMRDGKTVCDSEYLSKEVVKQILNVLVDNCELLSKEED